MSIRKTFGSTTSNRSLSSILVVCTWLLFPAAVMAKNVLIETPLGVIEIELLEEDAPETVANFLNYIDNNRYDKAFMHRSVPGFIIQGGGFTFDAGAATAVPTFGTVDNEFKISNTRGTLAMAKVPNDPNSATSQWFINLADNSGNLDNQNGGFTVFARVLGDGMLIADAIAALPLVNAGGAFSDLPVIDFSGGSLVDENLVFTAITRLPVTTLPDIEPFVMNAGLNDAWFNPDTNGQGFFITVFPDLNFVTIAWFTYDTDLPTDGETANLGDPGHRWITAGGVIEGNRAVMDINVTSGGLFDNEREVQNTDPVGADGTITLTFDDCASGLIEYDITSIDQQGSVPIRRVAGDNEALCLALLAPAEN